MRLIDADAELKEAKELSGPQTGDGWDNWGVYALIERQPTIDAVPVKHGKWSAYEVSGYRKCSKCGGYVNWNPKPFLFGDGEYNYCPNCGAKMDGGKDDV